MRPTIRHLYVHVPFCARVCPYCSFYVHRGSADRQHRFVQALLAEIRSARSHYEWKLETIYFGGGTPSLLSPELVAAVAVALPEGVAEFTLEVNPATVTAAKAEAWRAAGVNRISLGAQSFDAAYLRLLGRRHQPAEIVETAGLLRRHGFENLNMDLMFALPSQPLKTWMQTLEAALACRPRHLSAYALTYEEDTPFFQQKLKGRFKTDEASEIAMFETTVQRLADAGLRAYEISNFALPGFESRHNRAYWRGEDYLGLGPSACSTVGPTRWRNVPDTEAYIKAMLAGGDCRVDVEFLDEPVRNRERIMFGLRTEEGVPSALFSGYDTEVARLIEESLAAFTGDRLRLTPRGRLVADSVAELFADPVSRKIKGL